MSSRPTDCNLLISELKDTHSTVPEDTSKHGGDFRQIQRSHGTPSKKAALAGGLSLGRKRPRSALQQSLAALQYIMYQLVRSRIISTDHRFIVRDSSHDHQS